MRAAELDLGDDDRDIDLGRDLGLALGLDLGWSTPPRLLGTACVPRAVRPTSKRAQPRAEARSPTPRTGAPRFRSIAHPAHWSAEVRPSRPKLGIDAGRATRDDFPRRAEPLRRTRRLGAPMRAAELDLGDDDRDIDLGRELGFDLGLDLGRDLGLDLGWSTPPRLLGTACVPRAVRPTSKRAQLRAEARSSTPRLGAPRFGLRGRSSASTHGARRATTSHDVPSRRVGRDASALQCARRSSTSMRIAVGGVRPRRSSTSAELDVGSARRPPGRRARATPSARCDALRRGQRLHPIPQILPAVARPSRRAGRNGGHGLRT
jgi:hypothetical protein